MTHSLFTTCCQSHLPDLADYRHLQDTIHRHRLASLKLELLKASPFTPPITLLVPAHNEESSIVESAGLC